MDVHQHSIVDDSVGYYWPIPHAQLYRDPPRLTDRGLLEERAEEHGRRRRVFHLTDARREVLARWLADPHTPPPETRNPALLKLTFAALGPPDQVAALAREQLIQHAGWLDQYRRQRADLDPSSADAIARTRLLDLGIRHEQAYVDYWSTLADPPP